MCFNAEGNIFLPRLKGYRGAAVYVALTYYHNHREEIERYIQEGEELATTLQRQIPSKLLQKLATRDAGADPLPPG